ncbi:MAG: LptF/LptG family permease, partial [Planctomycetes bacterium]|nr:LptF/LptG family permease [Planctomycetota bacterium]
IAGLVAAVLSYGRMRMERESLALFAGGIPPRSLLLPVVILGVVCCFVAGHFNFISGPKAYRERDSLRRQALADALHHPPPGQRIISFPNIKICYRDYRDDAFEGVLVLTTADDGKAQNMLTCARAALRFSESTSTLTLLGASDAMLLRFDEHGRVSGPSVRLNIRSLTETLPIDMKTTGISTKAELPRELMANMRKELADGKAKKWSCAEFVKRLLFTLSPLFFIMTGALTGLAFPVRNRLVALVLALVLAAGTFYPLTLLATNFTSSAVFAGLGPLMTVALPPLIVGGAAVAMACALLWKLRRG